MKSHLVSHSNGAWLRRLIAPFLRSGASQEDTQTGASGTHSDEVLPHYYGTHEKDTPHRAAESVHGEADAGGGGNSSASQPGSDRPLRVDGQQLSGDPRVDPVCRA